MAFYSSKENQDFYVNTTKLSGIQGFDFRWESLVEPSLQINNNTPDYLNSRFIEGDLNIDYIPLNNDILSTFTGNSTFSGKFNYNDKYFVFRTGVLNNYSLSYDLNSVVSAKAAIKIFAEIFSETGVETLKPTNFTIIPYTNNYLDVYFDNNIIDKTLIEKLNLVIECEKKPSYKIGKYLPEEFIPSYPLKINFNFIANIQDYNFSGITNIYNKPKVDDLTLKLKNYNDNSNSKTFTFQRLTKADESSNFSTVSDGQITFNYFTLF